MILNITKLETKQGEKGPFWKVETDQGIFYSFDLHLGPGLLPGQWDVEVEQKGNYKHILTAKHIAPPMPGKAAPLPPPGNGQTPLDRDTMIARQVALKAAVELAGYLAAKAPNPEEITSKKILITAAAFEDFLTRPLEKAKP